MHKSVSMKWGGFLINSHLILLWSMYVKRVKIAKGFCPLSFIFYPLSFSEVPLAVCNLKINRGNTF